MLAGRAKQVSGYMSLILGLGIFLTVMGSASPLNGQAAEWWDKDKEEFQRLVLSRHRDLTEDELKGSS